MLLSQYTHQNLVSLLGYCDEEDEKVLVYEFASKGSLDRHLSDPDLTWVQRIKICLGAAKGLSYLHDPKGRHQRVLHCDIKSANILLHDSLTAKVADFGLSKMGPANQKYSVIVTNALGTPGYCDPLYMTTYTLTKESDVYSFGVVLFEVLCGRLCYAYSNGQTKVFVNMWKKKFSENKLNEIVFQDLEPQMDRTSLELFSDIAFQCLNDSREGRPKMSIVVEKLEKALEFASKGSLDRHLSDPDLTWVQRIKICLGAAKGLNYLHDPKGRHQRVLHCDIKSANILLDESFTPKVADVGLSKMGPANQQNSVLLTNALDTVGYCDPLFMHEYTLTKESDVYSFGVVLFEVLCGRLCYQNNNGQVKVFVNMWIEKFLEKKLDEIVFQDLETQMDRTSLELFSNIAFQCVHFSREGRPTMSIVVEKLEKALEFQELYDQRQNRLKVYKEILNVEVYTEILNAAEPPLMFTSIDDLNELLSNGVFLNAGKTWFSRNDEGEHYVMISLAECLIPTRSNTFRYSTRYDSRFKVGCYSTYYEAFKVRAKTQFLSPLTTYRVNLVFKFTKNYQKYKPEYLPLNYTLNGETKVSIVHLANVREDEWLKADLYQFTSHERTVDLEIDFDEHYHCDGLQIEGIEFEPIK